MTGNLDDADGRERLAVEHRDRVAFAVAGEAAAQVRGKRDPVHARSICDFTYRLAGVQVERLHVSRARHEQPMVRLIDGEIVPFVVAGDRPPRHDTVAAIARRRSGARERGQQ
jgi:hypothetical protein